MYNMAGRPTLYNDEILTKARTYLVEFEKRGEVVPTIEGLSEVLDISRETIYDWARQPEKEAFSDITLQILAKQAKTLINKGLAGDFNHSITKLMLSKHGYHEKQEVEHSGGVNVNVINFNDANPPA